MGKTKLTFNSVQKAVLAADDAKGTGYDVRANQFSASFSQMFKFLASKDVDYLEACEKNPGKGKEGVPPGVEFLTDTLKKYVKEEINRRLPIPKT